MVRLDYDALDPGIREVVRIVRAHGFKTTDSGDGVSKPADERVFNFPHVACRLETAADMAIQAVRLLNVLREMSPRWHVEATFSTKDGVALLFAYQEQVWPET